MLQRASSRLELHTLRREAHQISSGGAGASYREILAKPAKWYSANMMVLVAALGGSGAVSCSMVEHMDGLATPDHKVSAVRRDGMFQPCHRSDEGLATRDGNRCPRRLARQWIAQHHISGRKFSRAPGPFCEYPLGADIVEN